MLSLKTDNLLVRQNVNLRQKKLNAGIWYRHSGHKSLVFNHSTIQSPWYTCEHGIWATLPARPTSSKQIAHRSIEPEPPSWTRTNLSNASMQLSIAGPGPTVLAASMNRSWIPGTRRPWSGPWPMGTELKALAQSDMSFTVWSFTSIPAVERMLDKGVSAGLAVSCDFSCPWCSGASFLIMFIGTACWSRRVYQMRKSTWNGSSNDSDWSSCMGRYRTSMKRMW